MEYEVGEIFELNGKYYQVIEGFCADCDLLNFCDINYLRDIIGECYADFRNDNKSICFKLIEEE